MGNRMQPARQSAFRRFVVLLCFGLSACGGGGGNDSSCTANPPPTINGFPPVAATAGVEYRAPLDASYNCLFVFICDALDIIQAPRGAAASHDFVYWTPSSGQANQSFQFTVATQADSCGNTASKSWTVRVYSPPVIESYASDKTAIQAGDTVTLTAVFKGTGIIDGIGAVMSGVPVVTGNIIRDTAFRLTVSNPAGASLSQTLSIHVIAPPSIESFSASPATIGAGSSSRLTWTLSGEFTEVQIDPGGLNVTGSTSLLVTPAATTTYVLTVTGSITDTSTALVTVVPPAAIKSFTATPPSTAPLGAVSLAVDFDGVNGKIEQELSGSYTVLASVKPGDKVDSGPLYHTTRYRLTVENSLGQRVTQDLEVPLIGPGTFQPAKGQPLVPGRSSHSAVRLADGRVFIAGGTPFGLTEIFDPVNETFTGGPTLLGSRSGASAVLLSDGRIFIVGGHCISGVCHWSELVDLGTGTVAPGPSLQGVTASGPAVPLADGRVLIVATKVSPLPVVSGIVLYDPVGGTLSDLAPCLYPYSSPQSLDRLSDGRVLAARGSGAAEVFVPGPDSLSSAPQPSAARSSGYSTALLLDGRVLFTGGLVLEGTPAEAYDPVANEFVALGSQQIAPGFGARANQTSTRLDNGAALVVGGGNYLPFAELFDPASGSFSVTGGLRTGRSRHTATLLKDGRVLVVGGCAGLPCEAEMYTP